jgi:hypothetical protein
MPVSIGPRLQAFFAEPLLAALRAGIDEYVALHSGHRDKAGHALVIGT